MKRPEHLSPNGPLRGQEQLLERLLGAALFIFALEETLESLWCSGGAAGPGGGGARASLGVSEVTIPELTHLTHFPAPPEPGPGGNSRGDSTGGLELDPQPCPPLRWIIRYL